MNYFKKVFNFVFPKEEIKKDKIYKILSSRIIYFEKENAIIFLPYKNKLVRDAILSMKFKNNFLAGKFFGEILYENLPEILKDLEIKENFINPLLINIPITKRKKLSRGYNQNDIVIENFYKLGGKKFIN